MPWRSIFQRALYPAWIAASGFALLAMTGPLPIHFSPSSRGTQCRGDPPFNGARYQAWIAASGCALLAMTADRHHREARERANSPLFRCAMQRQPALILRSRIAASRRTRAEMKRTLESLVVRDAAAPLLTMRGPLLIHFSPSSRGAQRRGDPSSSGSLKPKCIAALGFARLARVKFIFTPLRNDRAQADLTGARPSLMTKIG